MGGNKMNGWVDEGAKVHKWLYTKHQKIVGKCVLTHVKVKKKK